jgi:hypothetical protein
MSAFDKFARTHSKYNELQKKWYSLFKTDLDKKAAVGFVEYYRKMKRQTKKQNGGMAPLEYVMTPGANVSVYGQFPTEIASDPASIRDLDIFFSNALTKDCGNPSQINAFPTPNTEMGSNQVGGRKRGTRKNNRRKTLRKNRKNMRKSYKHRGGSLMTTLGYHPYLATAPPNLIQSGMNMWNGGVTPIPFPSAPTTHQWQYVSNGTIGTIDPGQVTPIGTNFGKLAGMDPYQVAQ